jgi:hypothetical protein
MTAEREHAGELRLRRFRAGELPAAEGAEVERHAAACAPCRARLRAFDDEQRQFERAIPFDRFAGGVERAHRVPRRRSAPALYAATAAVAAVAALALIFVMPRPAPTRSNHLKGGTSATLLVGGASGDPRPVAPGGRVTLQPGERVRLGVRSDEPRYLAAVSIDEAGAVTALYPEHGPTLAVTPGPAVSYLPDSLEFTGRGRERVVLVLAARAVAVESLAQALRAAYREARGDLDAISPLRGEGEQFTWLLNKP